MTILEEATIIIEAFLFRPPNDSIEEFKPTGTDLAACLSKLLKLSTEKTRLGAILALHIHYQSCRLLNVDDEELVQYRSLIAKLCADFGLKEYAALYNRNFENNATVIPSELVGYATPYQVPETILNILHRKVHSLDIPQLETLFKFASVDVDAARYLLTHCFIVYNLAIGLINSLLNGRHINDRDLTQKYNKISSSLNSEFKLLLQENMELKHTTDPKSGGKPLNLERIAKGYLNPSWDWRDGHVDPSVRFVYEFLRVDKPQDVRHIAKEDLEFKGSLELTCFYSQYMNKVTGKLFGCAPLLAGTFPEILPESLPQVHFDQTIKLNGVVQQPVESISTSFKEWSSFCVSVNETLRMLNLENQHKMDAVWMFRNKPDPMTTGYSGFLYACGLKGLLKELPLIAIMDILKSGNKVVQTSLLLGLGLSYRGQYMESIERVLSMHIRSHFMNTLKIQISADVQGAAILGYGFMYYNSCDRQALKTLFSEFQRSSSQHEKTTIGYPPSFYLNVAIAIGMVSSGDMRTCLSATQLDSLLSTANGYDMDGDREFAALIALTLGALGTGDTALSNCVSLEDKQNIRPYFWFAKHLCRLCIEWNETVNIESDWSDEYSLFESAAVFLYSAIRCKPDRVTDKLLHCLSSLDTHPINTTEGLAFKRVQTARDFAADACLLSSCILNSGSREPRILRHLARHFASTHDYNHGRSVLHSMAAGFLCIQNGQRLDLSDHFSIATVLISCLPVWSREFTDMTSYFMPLRYLWAMAMPTSTLGDTPCTDRMLEASTILCENAIYQAFTHNRCDYTPQQLADIFKKV